MLDLLPARLQLVKALPTGTGWRYEPKLDGYRGLLARELSGRVRLTSRNGKDLTRWFPEMVRVAEALPPGTVIDGEIVSPANQGVSFTQLQQRLMISLRDRARVAAESPVALIAFDVLVDRSEDVRRLSLGQRRQRLERLVGYAHHDLLQLMTQVNERDAAEIWLYESLDIQGIEGVVAKRDEPYPKPNVRRWQKVRRLRTMDFLVFGFAGDPRAPRLVAGFENGPERHVIGHYAPASRGGRRAAEAAASARCSERAPDLVWVRYQLQGRVVRRARRLGRGGLLLSSRRQHLAAGSQVPTLAAD